MTSAEKVLVKLQSGFFDVERLGQELFRIKEELINLDKARQQNREGLTALRKGLGGRSTEGGASTRGASGQESAPSGPKAPVWVMRPGGLMLRMDPEIAQTVLNKEQAAIEAQIEAARAEQKRLVASLADKGISPDDVGPGLLQAYLNLRDK